MRVACRSLRTVAIAFVMSGLVASDNLADRGKRIVTAAEPLKKSGEFSRLWGESGELFDPRGRLDDYSYAGYRRGESSPAERPVDASVRDYGAVGDGVTDDSDAFLRALAACPGKVLSIPPGRYLITKILTLRDSQTVLRGAGPGDSKLICPTPLQVIRPEWAETTTGQKTSRYSWSGGILEVVGSFPNRPLARVASAASRGERSLRVDNPRRLVVGQDYVLRQDDDETQSLTRHLYAEDPGSISELRGVRELFAFRVTAIDVATRTIELDRPLRTDVRETWSPIVLDGRSSVEEVGIEQLGFEFPAGRYAGHFTEQGFNAIAMIGVRNSWIRNIHIHNADSGLFVGGSQISLTGIRWTSERPPERTRQATGHHGIILSGQDHLLTDFSMETRFMHDITVTRGSAGNVVMKGRGIDLCLDHHRYAPHSNLFTDLDLGVGSRMFQSGGGANLGRHCGAYETFWNIRSEQPQTWPVNFGPDRINLIGLTTHAPSRLEPRGRWFEAIAPERLSPPNLYSAQLAKRLGRN